MVAYSKLFTYYLRDWLFFDHMKNVEELYLYVFQFFRFFVFRAKSGTANNHRNGSVDISYLTPFSRDWNI